MVSFSAHQQGARHFAAHELDLVHADALGHQLRHEQLQAVSGREVTGLSEIGPENEISRADCLDSVDGLLHANLPPRPHPFLIRLRPCQRPLGNQFRLRAHVRIRWFFSTTAPMPLSLYS